MAELYRQPVDIILSELHGRKFCGSELISIVRGDAALRDIPILMLTARSDHCAAIQALRAGADAVVKKPFHFEVLIARIERELQRRHAVQELHRDNRKLDARVTARDHIWRGQGPARPFGAERLRLEVQILKERK